MLVLFDGCSRHGTCCGVICPREVVSHSFGLADLFLSLVFGLAAAGSPFFVTSMLSAIASSGSVAGSLLC